MFRRRDTARRMERVKRGQRLGGFGCLSGFLSGEPASSPLRRSYLGIFEAIQHVAGHK